MELELADSTIKLLRLLANLCIEDGVGERIVENPDIIEVFNRLSSFIYEIKTLFLIFRAVLILFDIHVISYHTL